MTNNRRTSNLNTILAIAAKDILDAIKNRMILTNLGVMILLILLVKFAPGLWKPGRLDITVYDQGDSDLIATLVDHPDIRLFQAASYEEFLDGLNNGDQGSLGLVIPADYDRTPESGNPMALRGYVLWNHRNAAEALRTKMEARLEALLGESVHIEIEGTVLHEPEAMGEVRNTALILVYTLFYMGVMTTPHLMLEEKQSKTIDSLLVSPASFRQIVAGKALAGVALVLITASLVIAASWVFVVRWDLALLGMFSGALLGVGIGLLLGILFDNKQQMNTWMIILAQPFMIAIFLSAIDPIFPQLVRDLLAIMPPVALSLVFRYSFSDGATMAQIAYSLSIVLGCAVLVLSIVAWKVARMDR